MHATNYTSSSTILPSSYLLKHEQFPLLISDQTYVTNGSSALNPFSRERISPPSLTSVCSYTVKVNVCIKTISINTCPFGTRIASQTRGGTRYRLCVDFYAVPQGLLFTSPFIQPYCCGSGSYLGFHLYFFEPWYMPTSYQEVQSLAH
jgi:hypothetical protein